MKEESTSERHRKVTIEEIADALGCSKSTVSRAISGNGRISDRMRKKILDYSMECGYRPNMIARSLAQSKTYNIAAVFPVDEELSEIPFFHKCLAGICEKAVEFEYEVIVTAVEPGDIKRIRSLAEKQKVDGFILTRALVSDPVVDYLRKNRLDFVIVGNHPDPEIPQINHHHVEACRELTSILLEGNDRVAFIGGDMSHLVSRNRWKGFQEGCVRYHRNIERNLIRLECTDKGKIYDAVEEIMEYHPDCIVCMDDRICSQVMVKLKDMRKMVPGDVRLASFYDKAFLQEFHPTVTAIAFDEKELGRQACQMLLDQINRVLVTRKQYLDYEIKLRESTK